MKAWRYREQFLFLSAFVFVKCFEDGQFLKGPVFIPGEQTVPLQQLYFWRNLPEPRWLVFRLAPDPLAGHAYWSACSDPLVPSTLVRYIFCFDGLIARVDHEPGLPSYHHPPSERIWLFLEHTPLGYRIILMTASSSLLVYLNFWLFIFGQEAYPIAMV